MTIPPHPTAEELEWLTVESALDPQSHRSATGYYNNDVWYSKCGRWFVTSARLMGGGSPGNECPICYPMARYLRFPP